MTFEKEVRDDVERLLTMIANTTTKPETFEFVLDRLTRMAIIGTAPAGCGPRDWSYKSKTKASSDKKVVDAGDDHSENKERWIAR
jgi:hypothetical protein